MTGIRSIPIASGVPLGPLTTLGVGGPATRLVEVDGPNAFAELVTDLPEDTEPPFVLGHGSNVVISDHGYPGTVWLMRGSGVTWHAGDEGWVGLTVAAGHSLEWLVRLVVDEGMANLECLAGIPGTVGAVPVQNVGAYGQDTAQSMVRLEAWDWWSRRQIRVDAPDCRFGYRTSRFKQYPDRYTILSVTFALQRSRLSRPVNYAQLATELDVPLGTRVPLADVRSAVLAIRRRKGMIIDPAEAESRSAGSFFLNPAIPAKAWDRFVRRVCAMCGEQPPELIRSTDSVRTSAGWLMQRAGFSRGQQFGSVRISHKHALALVAQDGTTATDIRLAASTIADRVNKLFGVWLEPEPRFVGSFAPWGLP